MRIGYPPTVLLPAGERSLGGDNVTKKDMASIVELASGASVHAVKQQLTKGYITAKGGYRIGVCGSVCVKDGQVENYSAFSSAVIRISRQMIGVADEVMRELMFNHDYQSTLIVSPPGGGKTTLLRDMVRILSERYCMRVALADERSEIAAVYEGQPQMDVGRSTDILDCCPKPAAVMMLLRAMNPQIIALDEITASEDAEAIAGAANCGVRILATAHGESMEDIMRNHIFRRLFEERILRNIIFIRNKGYEREYILRGSDEIC